MMAKSKGTFEKLTAWFFEHQEELSPVTVRRAAKEVGGIDDYDASTPKAIAEVKAEAAEGAKLKIEWTPTIFINGKRLPRTGVPPQYFQGAIELELKRPQQSRAADPALLPGHGAGRNRSIGLPRPVHRHLVAALQRGTCAPLEGGRSAGRNREAVDAELKRWTRALQPAERSLDLECASGRVVIDIDLPRDQRAVGLTVAHHVQGLADFQRIERLNVPAALDLGRAGRAHRRRADREDQRRFGSGVAGERARTWMPTCPVLSGRLVLGVAGSLM